MSRGPSGKVVIEPGVDLKESLYRALQLRGISLKDWFCRQASELINETEQPIFPELRGDSSSFSQNTPKRKQNASENKAF